MSAGGLKPISESPVDSLRDSDQFSIKVRLNSSEAYVKWRIFFTESLNRLFKSYLLRCFFQGDVLLEENEDEAAMTSESVGGFFVKHGTFMGTENEFSQSSDAVENDSDYDTDLETEGEIESGIFLIFFPFWLV